MSVSRVLALNVVAIAVAGCHRYDYRPPVCPPVVPSHPIRMVVSTQIRGSVLGVVSSQRSDDGLGPALVTLLPRSAPDTSDIEGKFRFDSVAAGQYTLVTRRFGSKERRDTLTVPDSAGLRLEVPLDPIPLDGCPGFMVMRVRRPWWRWLW